jgi:hypothetical protein
MLARIVTIAFTLAALSTASIAVTAAVAPAPCWTIC